MNTIVCGVDGSAGAREAVRVSAALARRLDARLVAVHVLDRPQAGAESVAAKILAEEAPGVAGEARVEVGDVAERLAAAARAADALMIVLGARRRGRSRAFLRARSVTGLASMTGVPVLVAPAAPALDAPERDAPVPAPAPRAVRTAPGRRDRRPRRARLRPRWTRPSFRRTLTVGRRP